MNKITHIKMHSGGAIGSDYLWDKVFQEYITDYPFIKEVNHYYYKNKTPYGNKEISNKDFNEGVHFAQIAANKLNRFWSNKPYIQYLLARNWIQVRESQVILAIGNLDKNTQLVSGGTGYAVEMAKYIKKPIILINLPDLQGKTVKDEAYNSAPIFYYEYSINRFINNNNINGKNSIIKQTGGSYNNFAGIGTRDIEIVDIELLTKKMCDILYYILPYD